MKEILEIFLDSLLDSLILLPFLLLSYFAIELFENGTFKIFNKKDKLLSKQAPFFGTLLGAIPQCGISSISAKAYSSGYIRIGTLVAILLMTSDEAVPILVSSGSFLKLLWLILAKLGISLFVGYLLTFICKNKKIDKMESLDVEIKNPEEDSKFWDVVISVFIKTFKIFFIILGVTFGFGILIHFLGEDNIVSFLDSNLVMSSIISTLIGLIPNCASSVILTKLYIQDIISFGTVLAGLLANSGVAFLVLFKENKNFKANWLIMAIIVATSVFFGIFFNIIF